MRPEVVFVSFNYQDFQDKILATQGGNMGKTERNCWERSLCSIEKIGKEHILVQLE